MDYGLDPELLAQQPGLEAQDVLAQLLRKQAMQGVQSPEGQMISGHYVAPNILQHIAAAMKPGRQRAEAEAMEQATMKKRVMLQQALAQAQNQWMGEMPQGTPGQAPVAPMQGAPIERGGQLNPEATGSPGVAPQLPSALQQMQWVGKGAQIPGNGPLAMALGKMAGDERTREDTQQAKREDLQATLIERLRVKQMEVAAQLEKEKMDNASAERIANIQAAWHKEVASTLQQIKDAKAKELTPAQQEVKARELQRQVEHMERSVEPVSRLASAANEVQDIIDGATDPKTGKIAPIPGLGFTSKLGMSMGVAEKMGAIPKGSVVNNQAVQNVLISVMRSNAGLTQTLTEQANTLKTMLAGGNFSQDQFTDGWKRFIKLLNSELENKTKVASPEALEIYLKRGGRVSGVKSKFDVDQGPATLGEPKVKVFNPTTGMLE
jgi:hypothetical protein